MGIKSSNVKFNFIKIGSVPTAFPITDNFDSQTINTDIWDIVQPEDSTITFVSDGSGGYYLRINYDSTPSNKFAGLVTKSKIPVGTKVEARVRRLSGGSIATLLGFGNYNENDPTGLFNGSNLLRIANTSSIDTDFVLRDESGTYFNTELSVGNTSAYKVVEILRLSESHIQVYFNDTLEYENTNVDFGDDYSVFFGGYGDYNTNGMEIDYITISEL